MCENPEPGKYPKPGRDTYLRGGELLLSSLIGLGLILGCASTRDQTNAPRPRDGIAEYRQITVAAAKAMRQALTALAVVRAESNACSPEVLKAFSSQMQKLQVDSIQLRARARAMQQRGEAYFERWHEHLAQIKDPEIRAVAEMRRPELQESFRRIKLLSHEAREAFEPFQADLRKVRNALESNPAKVSAPSIREQISSATEYGKHVERCLVSIISELDSMRAMLTSKGRERT